MTSPPPGTPHLIEELPEHLRDDAKHLLEDLAGDSLYKRLIIIEALRLVAGDHAEADMKMLSKVLQEVRTGLDVFRPYKDTRKVSVFGSARIPPNDARYEYVKNCARALREAGFMIITGGGHGMMQAANEGAGRDYSFGININLPLEQKPNPCVDGSPRHFYCQYFFTRKLFFLKESDAVVLTPGGFGTLDETFETLTLIQTGRNPPIPVVMLDAPGDDFWGPFIRSWMRRLTHDHLISPDDDNLVFHTNSIDAAVAYIRDFYINYHSFRYVGHATLLRLQHPLSDESLRRLNAEFSDVIHDGCIEQVFNWPKSDDPELAHLPRLKMHLDRSRMNVLPQIIRRMNALYQRQDAASSEA